MEQDIKNFLSTEEVNKLPKWAQTKVNVLHMRLKEAKKEIARLIESPKSNTIVGNAYKFNESDILQYLKNNETVTFSLSEGNIRIRIHNDMLDVLGDGFMDKNMCVFPEASSHLQIALRQKRLP